MYTIHVPINVIVEAGYYRARRRKSKKFVQWTHELIWINMYRIMHGMSTYYRMYPTSTSMIADMYGYFLETSSSLSWRPLLCRSFAVPTSDQLIIRTYPIHRIYILRPLIWMYFHNYNQINIIFIAYVIGTRRHFLLLLRFFLVFFFFAATTKQSEKREKHSRVSDVCRCLRY